MDDLIKALQILRKYGNPNNPTHCEHDILTVCDIDPAKVSQEDIETLKHLGFLVGRHEDCFYSYRFGSC